jgi:hypothetical protein
VGRKSKNVNAVIDRLVAAFSPELAIPRKVPADDLAGIGGTALTEAISRLRRARSSRTPDIRRRVWPGPPADAAGGEGAGIRRRVHRRVRTGPAAAAVPGTVPAPRDGQGTAWMVDEAEERRLLFVGVTRARAALPLLRGAPRAPWRPVSGRSLAVSGAIDPALLSRPGTPKAVAAGPAAPAAVTRFTGQIQACWGGSGTGRKCNSIRVFPSVFGFTQSRPRNSATPSS